MSRAKGVLERPTYEEMEPTFKGNCEELVDMMENAIRVLPLDYGHGLTPKEIEKMHKLLVKKGKYKKVFGTYENRVRDLFNKYETAGKHYVHGYIHYFPLSLHEKDIIDHSRCEECRLPKREGEA